MTRTVLGLVSVAIALCALLVSRAVLAEVGPGPILGYAWSETIGWIDLNCANSNTCASIPWGVSVDAAGVISGYAWSDNVGWLSANAADLVACPSGPCIAALSASNFDGWLKALSGGSSQSGGWDGYVSLSGPGYGVSISNGTFSGFAWGSTVIGWTDFAWVIAPQCTPTFTCVGNAVHNSCTGIDTPCSPGLVCSAGVCISAVGPPAGSIRVSPSLVRSNESTQVIWSVSDASSCTVSEDNTDITDAWTGTADTKTSSPLSQRTTYTLSCVGEGGTLLKSATVNIIPGFREI